MSTLGNNLMAQYYAQNQGLPFGYEAVEYLESTGTQYIDTVFVPNQDTSCQCQWYISENNSRGGFFGASNGSAMSIGKSYGFNGTSNLWDNYNDDINTSISIRSLSGKNLNINKNKNITTLSGDVSWSYTHEYTSFKTNPSLSLHIFNVNRPTIQKYSVSAKLKSYFKIFDDLTLVRNFIPCIRKSDGKPGLYDLCRSICPLTGTPFYINDGTGEFVTP